MELTEAQVCTQIITKGISCLPACSGLITTQFSLAGCRVRVQVGQVGGSHPLAPGEYANFYKPVDAPPGYDDHPAFYSPTNQDPLTPANVVTIAVTFNGKTTEKEYIVKPSRARFIVRVANFINVTEERISAVVSNINRVVTQSVKVLNFRKKR